jgi:hypothetical protein
VASAQRDARRQYLDTLHAENRVLMEQRAQTTAAAVASERAVEAQRGDYVVDNFGANALR